MMAIKREVKTHQIPSAVALFGEDARTAPVWMKTYRSAIHKPIGTRNHKYFFIDLFIRFWGGVMVLILAHIAYASKPPVWIALID